MSRTLELILGGLSLAMAVGMLAAVPWAIRRLPPDYFVRRRAHGPFVWRVIRNVAGALLVALGLAMLVLPGQGLLTVLLGLSVLDFEAKDRALAWVFRRPKVADAIQNLRTRAGRPPLILPA